MNLRRELRLQSGVAAWGPPSEGTGSQSTSPALAVRGEDIASLSRYNPGRWHFFESHAHERRHADPLSDPGRRRQAAEQLLPLVYEELRKLAAQKMAQEKPGQTLQATALVHEAYIRLVDVEKAQHWDSAGSFLSRPLPRPCGEFWWNMPAARVDRKRAASRQRSDLAGGAASR